MTGMAPTEEEKLKIRIEHWIEHNMEHAEEFTTLAATLKTGPSSAVSADLLKAAEELGNANRWLKEALKKIGRK